MNIHEYQAKEWLRRYGIDVVDGFVIDTTDGLEETLKATGWDGYVIKAQIHAGARGQAGAIKMAKGDQEALLLAEDMLGNCYRTRQTGPRGKTAHQLLITPKVSIDRELFIAITYDRQARCVCLIASSHGGIHIEENDPQKKAQEENSAWLKIEGHLHEHQKWRLFHLFELPSALREHFFLELDGLVRLFYDHDLTLLEINPWAFTREGQLMALDAKMIVDDNALFRQKELESMFDPLQSCEEEVKARADDLSYVAMDGNIGCMVNGAGLAMATMDLLAQHKGSAANFLDIGGGADIKRIAAGFEIISESSQVKVILVNIFGGIIDCALIAEGILQATKVLEQTSKGPQLPLIIRLEGNNVEKAQSLLQDSHLPCTFAKNLDEAARLAVKAAMTTNQK